MACNGDLVLGFMGFFSREKEKSRNEVTMSPASCYRVEIYSGWTPDEGKVRV